MGKRRTRRDFLAHGSRAALGLLGALYACGSDDSGASGAAGAGGAGTGGTGTAGSGTAGAATGGSGAADGSVGGSSGSGGGPLVDSGGSFGHRVVRVQKPGATSWDYQTGYYFDHVDQSAVDAMMDAAVVALSGASSPEAAYKMLFASYQPGQIVAVKINTNDVNWGDGNIEATSEVINSVVRGLVSAGIPEANIQVYDAFRPGGGPLPSRFPDRTHALYPGVVFLGPDTATFDGGYPNQQVSVPGWSANLCDWLCAADHVVLIPLMKAIRLDWGNTGACKLNQGSNDNPGGAHGTLADPTPSGNPMAAINSNPNLQGKLRLVVGDGLFGMFSGVHFTGAGETDDVPVEWQTFANGAPNSLFLAVDCVAIDSVMFDFIQNERIARGLPAMDHPILDACAAAGVGVQEHSASHAYTQIDYIDVSA